MASLSAKGGVDLESRKRIDFVRKDNDNSRLLNQTCWRKMIENVINECNDRIKISSSHASYFNMR